MSFDLELARKIGASHSTERDNEKGLAESFAQVCGYLAGSPDSLSWQAKSKPSLNDEKGLEILAQKFFSAYRASSFPLTPNTVPDEMVSVVMQFAYDHPADACNRIKVEHQQSMAAENCVGALLERYLDSALRAHGWHWCCGSFVKAVDFVKLETKGNWHALQIKNRDNSENSSSSAIRKGTTINKWFRTYSRTGKTNWANLPAPMQDCGLSEEGFIDFVKSYLTAHKPNLK